MKKNYFIILLSLFIGQIVYSQCTMNLRMYDDWGDGWNGNTITVTVNGTAVITAATLTGSGPSSGDGPEDISFTASTGDTVRTIWNGGGSYAYEVGYEIIANDGTVLFQENMSGVGTTAGSTAPSGNSGNNLAVCPSCPAPSSISFSGITSSSAIVSWSSVPALVYGIEYGVTGFTVGTGTQDTSAAMMKSLTGLTANTTYDFYVKALCTLTDSSTVAGPFSFTTPCLTASIPYLQDFSSWPPTCWDMTGGSHSFINASGVARANFWSISSGDLYMTSETILVSANARLKFDWSKNGSTSYNDSVAVQVKVGGVWTTVWGGSSLASNDGAFNTSPGSFVTETIILDSATYTNKTIQIRVVGVSDYGPDFFIDNVIVEAIPNCPDPITLSAFNIAATSADVSWFNTAGSSSFRLEYGAPGFTLGTGTSSIETNDTASLSGLSAFTTYEFYVTSICTPTDSSPWVGPYSFTTLCNDTNMGPWMDDVEGHPGATTAAAISNCWSATKSGSYEWEISTSGTTSSGSTGPTSAHSGTNFFYTEASSGSLNDTTMLMTPSIDVSSLTTPFLEFYYHMFGATIGSLSVEVYNGTSWTNELTLTGAQQATQASPWAQKYVDLSSYSGVIKIRFVALRGSSYTGDISIDDIAVIESPSCFPPSFVQANGTLNDTTTASWTQVFGTPTKYYVEYGAAGFTPGTGTMDSTTTTMLGIGGLTGSTPYEYYVVAYCGGTDSSAWVGPIPFTTKCDPYTPTHAEDFASYLPTCWEEKKGVLTASSVLTGTISNWKSDGFANVGLTGAASMNIYSTGRNEWLISAPIDLGDGTIPYQVEYDVALTNYASTGPDAMGSDDTLALVISTDFGQTWSTANILRNYVAGDQPSNAGNREFIDLSGYTGIVQFGFYAASSVSNADYDVHIDNFLVIDLCVPSVDTINDIACGTYTSPTGNIYTTAGVYFDTLQKTRGCDSIIMINLTVNNSTASFTETVCNSYTSPSGKIWTVSGVHMDTIPNAMGCDSIMTFNLTVNYDATYTNTVTVCDSYTKPDGTVVNYSGTFIDVIPTSLGCDSTITTILTVNYTTHASWSVTACDSYTSPSGKVINFSGTVYDTLTNTSGCDSLMVINLTIVASTSETRTVDACFTYTQPETGNVYSTSGTYTDVVTNSAGCSHTITTVLTINTANAGTISVSGITLTSSATGVSYKWVDCDNEFSFILGATSQSYTPKRNGSYACWVTTPEGCTDTTGACVDIISVSLDEYKITASDIDIYPNPATNFVTVDILNQNTEEDVTIRMFDAVGKLVYSQVVSSTNNKITFDVSQFESGLYTVTVSNEFFLTTKKVVVSK